MARIKQSPKLPPEKRREQLLAAARKLFVRKGYRGTTTEEIARKAGLTKGALYHHFDSKEEILLELIKSISQHNEDAFDKILSKANKPSDIINALVKVHCDCGSSEHEFGDIVDIWVQAWRVPRIRKYITGRISSVKDNYARHIEKRGLPRGIQPADLIIFGMALADGLSGIHMLAPGVVDFKKQEKLVDWLIKDKVTARKSSRRKQK